MAGEIHSAWRSDITERCYSVDLPIEFSSPITNHQLSDDIGKMTFGPETGQFWNDHKSARLNQARNKVLLEDATLVVVRFGENYRQWNSAFDAGYAVAQGKPLITWHDTSLNHALKEIDSVAAAVASDVEQVVKSLAYICCGRALD